MINNFRKIMIEDSDHILVQAIRYFFVAGTGLIFDFVVLFFLTEALGVHYLISAVAGFSVGLAINYFLSIRWVFNGRTMGDRRLEFLAFAGVGVIGLGINTLGIWILTDKIGVYFLLSKVVITGFVFAWNFLARRRLLVIKQPT